MPVGGASTTGNQASVSALPSIFEVLNLTVAGAISKILTGNNLPWLNVWLLQTAGPGVVGVQIQFADGVTVAGTPDWQPLVAPIPALVTGTPQVVPVHLGARLYRIVFSSTGAATVRYHATASMT